MPILNEVIFAVKSAFACKRCGKCCEGKGGIVLSEKDLERLAAASGTSRAETIAAYAEISNGKLRLRVGPDGRCVFFKTGSGCSVHADKPDVCRAWPFFRGNLVDEISFEMAREFCPGIDAAVSHADFAREGMEYLVRNSLVAGDRAREANALIVDRQTPGDAL